MWKLIKMEWKKNCLWKMIRNAAIMTTAVLLFVLLTAGEAGADMAEMGMFNKSFIHASVELYTHMSYMIFTGVLLAGFVVDDYKKGTIRLLFSYPVKRKKLVLAKVFAVWIFSFTAMVISKLVMYAAVLATGPWIHIPASDIPYGNWPFWVELFLSAAAMVSISFLALPIGMKMRSSKAAVVASIIIVCFTQGNIGEFTLTNNVPFYLCLFGLAMVSVFLAIRQVEQKDV